MRLRGRKHRKTLAHIRQLEHEMGMDLIPGGLPPAEPLPRLTMHWDRQGNALLPRKVKLNFDAAPAASACMSRVAQ